MKLARIKFALAKYSPTILIVAGVAGTIASTIMACRATLQLDETLEHHNSETARIKDAVADETLAEYTEENARHDITVTYVKTGVKLIRLYAPAVAVGAFSLAAIITSNGILRRRNVALAAAYTAIDEGFKRYRSAVVERFGETVDYELRTGVRNIEARKTVEEDGKKKKVKENVDILPAGVEGLSDYAVVFGPDNPNWEPGCSDYNRAFLNRQQAYFNDKLRSDGYLYLNDVYKELGFPCTKAGQIVGWVFGNPDEDHPGDNYVDFGAKMVYPNVVLDPDKPAPDLAELEDPVFILDFNVDGNIWDLM